MKIMNVAARLMCLPVLAAIMMGCLKEDVVECEVVFDLTVRAYDNYGAELPRRNVHAVKLYIFDDQMRFIKSVDTNVGLSALMELEIPEDMDIHVVGWGNLDGGSYEIHEPAVGDHISECYVDLLKDGTTGAASLGDLFRGEITLTPEQRQQGGEIMLPMYRQGGSMNVTIRGLKAYAGFDDDDYSIVVHGISDQIDFSGNRTGDETTYTPSGAFIANETDEEFYARTFSILPAGEIVIDIYHGTELITSISQNSDGSLIAVEQGLLTNVLIKLESDGETTLDVRVSITNWGEEQLWKDF